MYYVFVYDVLLSCLFDDLRIDEDSFLELDFEFILNIAPLYHSNTLLTLVKYIKELKNVNN